MLVNPPYVRHTAAHATGEQRQCHGSTRRIALRAVPNRAGARTRRARRRMAPPTNGACRGANSETWTHDQRAGTGGRRRFRGRAAGGRWRGPRRHGFAALACGRPRRPSGELDDATAVGALARIRAPWPARLR